METFLITVTVLAFITTASLFSFLKRSAKAYFISIAMPLIMLVGYVLLKQDEFGYWALLLTFGACYSLIGSAMGVLVSTKLSAK